MVGRPWFLTAPRIRFWWAWCGQRRLFLVELFQGRDQVLVSPAVASVRGEQRSSCCAGQAAATAFADTVISLAGRFLAWCGRGATASVRNTLANSLGFEQKSRDGA